MSFVGLWVSAAFIDICCRRCMGFAMVRNRLIHEREVLSFMVSVGHSTALVSLLPFRKTLTSTTLFSLQC